MIKGVVFDIDGTLLDSMPYWHALGSKYLITKNITPELDLGEKLGPLSVLEGVTYLKRHYHLKESQEDIQKDLMKIMNSFYESDVQLKPGVKALLDDLHAKDIEMVLCTTGMVSVSLKALKRLGIADYFEKVFPCETKEEPSVYLEAASFLRLAPQNILVIEDDLTAIQSAHQADFKVCGVYDLSSAKDEYKIRKISDAYVYDLSSLNKL